MKIKAILQWVIFILVIFIMVAFVYTLAAWAKRRRTKFSSQSTSQRLMTTSCRQNCENKYRAIIDNFNAKFFKMPLTPDLNNWPGYPSTPPPANSCLAYERLPNLPANWCQQYQSGINIISKAYDCCIGKCQNPILECPENVDIN